MDALRRRIVGVETEFGCLVSDEDLGRPEDAVEAIKDYLFLDAKVGVLDVVARDEVFEPAQSGGFLLNGGRLYIDAVGSHLEYATAECTNLRDLIAHDRAGQRLILRALDELRLSDAVSVYNNSIDHFGGHTFGCHENYLVAGEEMIGGVAAMKLLGFLATRQIFAGVGRVGGHLLVEGGRPSPREMARNPVDFIWVGHVYDVLPDDSVRFQLSQRADHILKPLASRVRFNRAMINPKWEHLYSYGGTTRLHLLFGEANQNEYAYALKVGTTMLVLRLLEEGRIEDRWVVANPVRALREVSRDETWRWEVRLADGMEIRAVDLQREYLDRAQAFRGWDEDTDWTLDAWEEVLDGLERDPMALADRLDWVAKRRILEQYIEAEGATWSDDALHSVDLEYHNIDPEKSLFHAFAESYGVRRLVSEQDIVRAMDAAPCDTRAAARAELIRRLLSLKGRKLFAVDWSGVSAGPRTYFDLSDPFDPTVPEPAR
ncbi:MAG: proteasome accessory factor PafA2 family protein [Fimbriimonadales bacterium]|nr:proteasome accessory factor PafA2 family protein [Fimbriimonadales bacterium]